MILSVIVTVIVLMVLMLMLMMLMGMVTVVSMCMVEMTMIHCLAIIVKDSDPICVVFCTSFYQVRLSQ